MAVRAGYFRAPRITEIAPRDRWRGIAIRGRCAGLLAPAQAPVADIASKLPALEADRLRHLVGAPLRRAHVAAERGHREDPPSVGHDVLAVQGGPGVEHAA